MKTTFLLLCLMFTPAFAADIVVPVQVTVQAQGQVPAEIISRVKDEIIQPMDCLRIWLDVPSEAMATIEYGCHPEPKLIQAGQTLDGKRAFLIFQAGSVGSFGVFVTHDTPKDRMKRYVIVTGGDIDPRPFLNPQPTPAPGKRKVIILEESGDKDREQYAPILFSTKLRKYLESKGHQLWIPDVDNVPTVSARHKLQGKSLPRLLIEDGDGKLIFQSILPGTVDAVIQTIKANGG